MKHVFIAVLMTLFSTISFAKDLTCDEEIQATFKELKVQAKALVEARGEDVEYINDVKLYIVDTLDNAVGRAHARSSKMEISRELCDDSSGYRNGVISHEWGHFVSFALYEDFKRSTNPRLKSVTDWQLEWAANEIGAQLFVYAGMDKAGMLAVADTQCSKNKAYFCDKAMAWRTGSLH